MSADLRIEHRAADANEQTHDLFHVHDAIEVDGMSKRRLLGTFYARDRAEDYIKLLRTREAVRHVIHEGLDPWPDMQALVQKLLAERLAAAEAG